MPEFVPPLLYLAIYNVIQNTVLPPMAYVPSNLLVTSGLVVEARRAGCSWDEIGLDFGQWRRSLRAGSFGAGSIVAAIAFASQVPSLRRYLVDERARGHTPRHILFRSLIRFPVGTALFEEVAFRGVLYGSCRRAGLPSPRAALFTAGAFALWHLLPGRTALAGNPMQERMRTPAATAAAVGVGALLTGVSSLGLTWLRNRTRSLLAPWLLHAAVNTVGYLGGVTAWRRQGKDG